MAISKLLSNYWKISTLFFISLILLIGKQNYALFFTNLSTILMTLSIWFWTDINVELKEYPILNSLTLTTKAWRWSLSFISLIFLVQSLSNVTCLYSINSSSCKSWLLPGEKLYFFIKELFNFLFGATFSEPIAKFFGLFALLIYIIGLIQWLLIKLPKSGRNSGFSNNDQY